MSKPLSWQRILFLVISGCILVLNARLGWLGIGNVRQALAINADLPPEVAQVSATQPAANPTTYPAELFPETLDTFSQMARRALEDRREQQLVVMKEHAVRGCFLLALAIVLTCLWMMVVGKLWRGTWPTDLEVPGGGVGAGG